MNIYWKVVGGLGLAVAICTFGLAIGYSERASGIEGWEKDSSYNGFYDLDQKDKLKGVVLNIINVTPLPGMAPGVGLVVRSTRDGTVSVHLGPRSFINLNNIWKMKGADVKVRGVWAEIDNEKVFMAYKVKSRSQVLKLRRTRDGTPHWTMTPEELARERTLK